jgi:AIPR protein
VATADVVDVGPTEVGGLGIQRLRGFQIVNGGQTTASLYRARKIDKSDLAGILVPAKIIIAPIRSAGRDGRLRFTRSK